MNKSDMPHDASICRTIKIKGNRLECLAAPSYPWSCGYSYIIGSKFYCSYLNRMKIPDPVTDSPDLRLA